MKKFVLFICLLFYFYMPSKAQNILVTSGAGVTVAQMVHDLVDPSIFTYGFSETCDPFARGLFTNNGSNLGLPAGVVLTTGTAKTGSPAGFTGVEGQNHDNCNGNSASRSIGGGSDPDLVALDAGASSGIHDACILNFMMVAPSDSMQVTYVFGSEEYELYSAPPSLLGAQYNDVFGFFMSGPGITVPGGYTGLDIANIPGSGGIYVGIRNINQNSLVSRAYYLNNCTTPVGTCTYCTGNPTNSIEYNGFSKVMTAKVKVTAGATYTVKLAVGDANDGILDTGVFIKANSIIPIVPLPVNLLDFSARCDATAQKNRVTWKTAQEENNSHFELMKRTDISPFKSIATIKGNGTSSVEHSYEYIDDQPGDGNNYYMLRQVDYNGKISLSKVISLQNLVTLKVNDIFPNPVGDEFTAIVEIPVDVSDARVELLDITGRVIRLQQLSLQAGSNKIVINTKDLITGTYFFRVIAGEYTANLQRIVK